MSDFLTANWNFPTRVVTGAGSIRKLPDLAREYGIAKPLLVTDEGLKDMAFIAETRAMMKAAGLEAGFFHDVQGNPTEANLDAGVKAFTAGGHDGVIAIGGGSALDVGKVVALMHGQSRPVWDFEDVGDWWTRADASKISPFIAVPTTAGTGSEVGRAGVITNLATHEKKIIFHPAIMPKVAIEDPELSVGLPPVLTAGAGMDALAHCFEAYCVNSFHPMADGVALEGIHLINTYLPKAVDNGADIEARAYMLAAASMGATAFQKGLGAIHSVSHPVGARYNTHHGMTNGVLFPYVMIANRPAIEAKMPRVAATLGLGGGFDAVLEWILDLRTKTKVPHTLADLGVKAEDVDSIAADAVKDPTAAANPRGFSTEQFAVLTRAAIEGDLSFEIPADG
ncbi:MAG: alcohol dehydrogenase [Rhizobiales bacterium]|nr:alcohol dehydrogenase [Hyphomicrobiales bacterium]MBA69557.1 alcohol dehydrogenase [Hyphomicrobiales bacterium]|tara:strand:+ start:483 stop:1670 length:1188 start_codon:yes stop_codon:yes gene_type:complete